MSWPAWTGLGERRWEKSLDEEVQPPKTLWDLLQLLVIPAMLVVIAIVFNAAQASREHRREDRRLREDRVLARAAREDATLNAYLSEMRDLILNHGLLKSGQDAPVHELARTETLVALHRMDGERKGEIIRFLDEAGLIACRCRNASESPNDSPSVDLDRVDLRGADLAGASLAHDTFEGADLRGAKFDGATMSNVHFIGTHLEGASFEGVTTYGNVFFDTGFLTGARFDEAGFYEKVSFDYACLTRTSFVRASFGWHTSFRAADGHDTDLRGARHFSRVRTTGATLWNAHVDDGAARPKGWRATGTVLHDSASNGVCSA